MWESRLAAIHERLGGREDPGNSLVLLLRDGHDGGDRRQVQGSEDKLCRHDQREGNAHYENKQRAVLSVGAGATSR